MTNGPVDAALIASARNGDRTALDALVLRHRQDAVLLAASVTGDHSAAEDVAHDAFIRAFRNLDLLAAPERFRPWFHRIVFATAIDWLRAQRPTKRVSLESLGALENSVDTSRERVARGVTSTEYRLSGLTSPAPSPLELAIHRDASARIASALAQLPPRYRVPITMYHFDGLSHAQVAAALGERPATVRSLVARARQRLAILLRSLTPDTRANQEVDVAGGPVSTPLGPGGTTTSDGQSASAAILSRPADLLTVFELSSPRRILHLLNGDATRTPFEQSGLPGDVAVWADVLNEGPVLSREIGDELWREGRAAFIAEQGWASRDAALTLYRSWDAALERAAGYDEVVIWCEHDVYDQLLLAHHLAWFAARSAPRVLSVVCIGEFPGMPDFKGLGELDGPQLASLFASRRRMSEGGVEAGRRAWRAFTADDPRRLLELAVDDDRFALPFLAPAVRRLLEEFPDSITGLSRSELAILSAVGDGACAFRDMMAAVHATEDRLFLPDLGLWSRVRALARLSPSLLAFDAGEASTNGSSVWDAQLMLTSTGHALLNGAHRVATPYSRWIGGVRVDATHPWRWDAARQSVVLWGDTASGATK